jgi:hypothetical protein
MEPNELDAKLTATMDESLPAQERLAIIEELLVWLREGPMLRAALQQGDRECVATVVSAVLVLCENAAKLETTIAAREET